ncbi:FHA domain-containing protein [Paracoccus liaowanqingii]|uniref:FHA domain-containing protein n=1 Tax=Paracoccus liaowanqingii TaxID=2560053 RepID=A0A4P7HLN2_9RHOB|nr:FHA domain-containing protein [Paracoccus liaowanqingii]QBX35075.1 FHA domain-containing protein [Paracoccus liaowanqingii]
MSLRGILKEHVAARLLMAAGLLDLMIVFVAARSLAPLLQDEIPALRVDYAEIVIFALLVPIMWIICDLLLPGTSPGRLSMGLEMAHKSGGSLSVARRSMRLLGKLSTLGLSGLRVGRLAGYDRATGTVWLSAMSRVPLTPPEQWRLKFINGTYAGRSIQLLRIPGFSDQKTLRIGRGEGWANIVLNDPKVSARHCLLRVQGQQVEIRDGAEPGHPSANGTFVHDGRISSEHWTPLPLDQVFQIGTTKMQLVA